MKYALTILSCIAATVLCASAAAQTSVTISLPQGDVDTSSPQFGFSLASTKTRLYIGAPYFDRDSVHDSGALYYYDAASLAALGEIAVDNTLDANSAFSLASTKTELVWGAPGYSPAPGGPRLGDVSYLSEKTGEQLGMVGSGGEFSYSVAISKKLLAAGAPGAETTFGGPTGNAYYDIKPYLDQPLFPLDPPAAAGDRAGAAVAVSPKYIAVGAPGATVDGVTSTGKVYIFDAKTRVLVHTLEGNNGNGNQQESQPRFGASLLIVGSNLFVGAPNQNSGNSNSPNFLANAGMVYRYKVGSWQEIGNYKSKSPQADAQFGSSLASNKKLLAVGSPLYDDNDIDAGLAEVFVVKTGQLTLTLRSMAPIVSEHFGHALAFLKKRIAVGAPAPDSQTSEGHVYVYTLEQ